MVRGYFYEMACVIKECHRVLKPDGYMFMVNDNVRYAGVIFPLIPSCRVLQRILGLKWKKYWFFLWGKGIVVSKWEPTDEHIEKMCLLLEKSIR